MFNSFEQFNMTPKNKGPENPITKSEDPPVENKPAEPTLDQAQDVSKFESPTSPETETSSTYSDKKPTSVKASVGIRDSAFSKVVGAPSEEIERSLLENSRHIFETQPIKESVAEKRLFLDKTFKKTERPATPEEAEMIRIVNQNMAEFVRQYDGEPLDIGTEQVHFIDGKKINKKIISKLQLDGTNAYYSVYDQSIIMTPRVDRLDLLTPGLKKAHTITHEFMHFNSFQSVNYDPKLPNKTSYRRCGMEMIDSNSDVYFKNLNEAVTEELAMRFERKFFDQIPSIKKDLELTKLGELSLKKDFEREQKSSASYAITPDVASLDKNGRMYSHSYFEERQVLGEYIRIIFKRNPGKFQSEEEVFEVFARAYFTGKTLELARLIEKTYPVKGAFRRIGEDENYQENKRVEGLS